VIEGSGGNALKIYVESEETKRAYLDIEVEHPDNDLPNRAVEGVNGGPRRCTTSRRSWFDRLTTNGLVQFP